MIVYTILCKTIKINIFIEYYKSFPQILEQI